MVHADISGEIPLEPLYVGALAGDPRGEECVLGARPAGAAVRARHLLARVARVRRDERVRRGLRLAREVGGEPAQRDVRQRQRPLRAQLHGRRRLHRQGHRRFTVGRCEHQQRLERGHRWRRCRLPGRKRRRSVFGLQRDLYLIVYVVAVVGLFFGWARDTARSPREMFRRRWRPSRSCRCPCTRRLLFPPTRSRRRFHLF